MMAALGFQNVIFDATSAVLRGPNQNPQAFGGGIMHDKIIKNAVAGVLGVGFFFGVFFTLLVLGTIWWLA
tara:strand:+ start:2325 stop:2534 length:210 start_codon:yes stop_codon:yes gene_type:complete